MICRTGQICIVQSPTMNFIFFTISNFNYTVFVSLAHISCTSLMYPSVMFRFRMHLHSTSRGTVSYAFSRSTNTMSRGLLPSLYFSHRVLITNMASVVPTPGLKSNCPSEMLTMSLSRWSIIRSQSFIVWLSSLIPL